MPETVALSPRLKNLFKETKLVCFGRYALTVPKEAQLIWGETSFPSRIYIFQGDRETVKIVADQEIARLIRADETAEITYTSPGPVKDSWQFRYYEDKAAKRFHLYFFNTYINKGELIFLLRGGVDPEAKQTEEQAVALETSRAKSLRLRTEDDIPSEEGYCIEHGFMASSLYGDQEMISAGIA